MTWSDRPPAPALVSSFILAFTAALTLAACSGDSGTSPESPVPSDVGTVQGSEQTVPVGAEHSLSVLVTGSDGEPVANQTVEWNVTSGDATVSPTSTVTDAEGVARTEVTTGGAVGPIEVQASVEGLEPVVFSLVAEAGPPARMVVESGDDQSGGPSETLMDSLVVVVSDSFGNPVEGAMVDFRTEDGGQLSPASMLTGSDGRAASEWTLGDAAETQQATAHVVGTGEVGEIFVGFSASAAPENEPYALLADGATDGAGRVDAAPTLTWKVRNMTADSLVFDIYLSTAADSVPQLAEENYGEWEYDVELATNAKYFWYVVARDPDSGIGTTSDTVSFTTAGYSGNRDVPLDTIDVGPYTFGENDQVYTMDYSYQISTIEVTNGVYAMWLNDNVGSDKVRVSGNLVFGYLESDIPEIPSGDYLLLDMSHERSRIHWNAANQSFAIDYGYGDHPVTFVTWYGAKAFAVDKGYRLPTAYEWEKAARGPSGFTYPWGDVEPLCGFVNFNRCFDDTKSVGSMSHSGDSYFGMSDMAGNVAEWTETDGGFANEATFEPVVKGGGWRSSEEQVMAWWELPLMPSAAGYDIGFRVVEVVERGCALC